MTKRYLAGLLAALSLAACGSKDKATTGQDDSGNPLALPITAPMKARDRALHDLKKHKDAAREREKQFDQLIGEGR